MGRSKWLLLLLIPMLFGFDTRNPFRTRGPFKAYDFTIGGGSAQGACTDGVDCYCDLVTDANLVFCEDFEDEDYYSDTGTGSSNHPWYKSPSGNNGYRGGDNQWMLNYLTTDNGNWRTPNPVSPTLGYPCTAGECGHAEWRADDLWQGNSEASVDIQREGEYDDEIAGLTLNSGHAGNTWVAYRIKPTSTTGIHGDIAISPPANSELGFAALIAYSSNMATAVSTAWNGDFTTQPWKHEEWGSLRTTLFMGNVGGSSSYPFSPGLFHSSQSNCNSMVSGATFNAGSAGCNSAVMTVTSDFDRSTQWPLGTWACVRGHISGLGTTSGTMTIWFNETKIFEMTNANFSLGLDSSVNSISSYVPNTYYNGNASLPGSVPSTQTFYKYQDNVHITKGVPPTCFEIGG